MSEKKPLIFAAKSMSTIYLPFVLSLSQRETVSCVSELTSSFKADHTLRLIN